MDIGSRIKAERIDKKLSQIQLAQKLGIKQQTLSRYESNIIQPSLEVLVLLADLLEVTADYLLCRKDF